MLYRLLKYINKERFNCIICSYKRSGKVIGLMRKTKSKIELLKEKRDSRLQLRNIIKKYNINVAYVSTYKLLREVMILKGMGCKIIYHMRNLLKHTHRHLAKDKKDMFLKTIFCLSDKIIACSSAVKKQFDFLKPGKFIEIIYNGIEIDSFSRRRNVETVLKQEYNISPDTKLVAIIARIEPQKEQRLFLRVCKKVKKSYQAVKFLIIGACDSPLFLKVLKNDIKSLSLTDSVILTGFRDDISRIIHDIDIVVAPSAYESFNTSLLEGMMAGKAVIATNTGGPLELVKNGKTGILLKPNDSKRFSESIIQLLKNNTERTRLGKNARKEAMAKYDIHLYTKKIEKIFMDTCYEK